MKRPLYCCARAKWLFTLICLLPLAFVPQAHAQDAMPWQDVDDISLAARGGQRAIVPESYRALRLEEATMAQLLATCPMENADGAAGLTLLLPSPDGETMAFQVWESPVMAPGLSQRFPGIRTYTGRSAHDARILLRADMTPAGFHAMVMDHRSTWHIDPYFHGQRDYYMAYHKRELLPAAPLRCEVEDRDLPHEVHGLPRGPNPVGSELRHYRLAVAATGEYTLFHGGTVEGALAAIATTMHRVNGVYERDLSVRMTLVDSNYLIIFTDPTTDPYSGTNNQKLGQNQATLTNIIGGANYDIGHVFDRGGGGVANLRSVCSTNNKARGYTATQQPVGDPFDIDYVAHEMGHQFGANHTFNNCGGAGPQAFEPGSATTIMGYAGLCGNNNVALNSDAHFHVANFDEMAQFTLSGGGNNCPVVEATGNTAPAVSAGASGYIIPLRTPFELTGSATDTEGDSLTYCWEQFDLGPSSPLGAPSGNAPAFRALPPTPNPTRVFPRLQDLVNNATSNSEVLPTYGRDMRFRLTVRDNHGFGGGVDWDEMTMRAHAGAGPFRVSSQNAATTWVAGSLQAITWDVANTDVAPISTQLVDIYLSANGGFTYPIVLAAAVPNNGATVVAVPDSLAGNAFRVKVKAVGNVYFDINNTNITIVAPEGPGLSVAVPVTSAAVCAPDEASYEVLTSGLLGFAGALELGVIGLPAGLSAAFSPAEVVASDDFAVQISATENLPSGMFDFSLVVASSLGSDTIPLTLQVFAAAPMAPGLVSPADGEEAVAILPLLSWVADADAEEYAIEVALDPGFVNVIYTASGIVGTSHIVAAALPVTTVVYWRVRASNSLCGAGDVSVIRSFTTESIICETYTTTALPVPFTTSVFLTSTIDVPDAVVIRDVNLRNLRGQYAPVGDLSFRLRSPGGTSVIVIGQMCDNFINFDLDLDDQAPSDIPCPYNIGGTYRPSNPLDAFNGEQANGQWRIIVGNSSSEGQLESWAVEICYGVNPVSVGSIRPERQRLRLSPNPVVDMLRIEADQASVSPTHLSLLDVTGRQVWQGVWQPAASGAAVYEADMSHLTPGMYFLQWQSEDGRILAVEKVVRQ